MPLLQRFLADDSAVTAEKYGLIAACISLAIAVVIQGVGGRLVDTLAVSD